MPTQPLTLMSALQGTYTINDTTEWNGKCDAVFVTDDAVFTTLNDDHSGTRTRYFSTGGGTVKAGTLIRPTEDGQFVKIKLASGQVTIIL